MLRSRILRSAAKGLLGLCLSASAAFAETTNAPTADLWMTNAMPRSAPYDFTTATTNGFEGLQAVALASRLKVIFVEPQPDTNRPPTLMFSIEAPGHWHSRDWTAEPMRFLNGLWELVVPIEDPDVPVVYFLQTARGSTNRQSRLRLCIPRLAGLETPTQLFWPFLEGFESGASQWRRVAGPGESERVDISSQARNGQGALRIELPAGRSRTVVTTRVRGSVLEQRQATGLRLWMRASGHGARARFTLIADASTAEQVVSPSSRAIELTTNWSAVDVPFNAFAKAPIGRVDRFAIECVSETANECFVDDMQLLGPWNPDKP